MNQSISTDKAPAAIGPYSQGITAGNLLFTSMQIALDPETGKLVGESAPVQVAQCLRNVTAIVEAGGGDMGRILKTTVYLKDMTQFKLVNDVYRDFFSGTLPARGVVEVSDLPLNALIAVEAVALIGD